MCKSAMEYVYQCMNGRGRDDASAIHADILDIGPNRQVTRSTEMLESRSDDSQYSTSHYFYKYADSPGINCKSRQNESRGKNHSSQGGEALNAVRNPMLYSRAKYVSNNNPQTSNCRFCLDSHDTANDRLISPCACKGSAKYVHQACLQKWRDSAANPYNRVRCEICHSYYRLCFPFSSLFGITSATICCWLGYICYAFVMVHMFRWMFGIVGVQFSGSQMDEATLAQANSLTYNFASLQSWLIRNLSPAVGGPCILLVGAYQTNTMASRLEPLKWWFVASWLSVFQLSPVYFLADSLCLVCIVTGCYFVIHKSVKWSVATAPKLLVFLADVNNNS